MLIAIISCSLAAISALFIFAAAPARAQNEKKAPFISRYFAHRGLHNVEGTVPENSLPAFSLAAKYGYAVELDVRLTKDGKVIVFHDDNLKRMCKLDADTESLTYKELRKLRLSGTNCYIPLLSEVLEIYAGAAPILLEIKTGAKKYELCRKTYFLLKKYKGDVCIESFDPRIVAWWRKNAREYIRGQLAQPAADYNNQPKILSFMLANSLLNFIGRPHFIAYKIGKTPLGTLLSEKMGAMKFSWTSRSISDKENQDGIIFEFYLPKTKF